MMCTNSGIDSHNDAFDACAICTFDSVLHSALISVEMFILQIIILTNNFYEFLRFYVFKEQGTSCRNFANFIFFRNWFLAILFSILILR